MREQADMGAAETAAPQGRSPARQRAEYFIANEVQPSTPVTPLLSMLPFSYLSSFLVMLAESNAVRLRSFDELQFPDDADIRTEEGLKGVYADEYKAWIKAGKAASKPAALDLFMLHDCDSAPKETQYLCAFEGQLQVKSTTSLFVRERDGRGNLRNYAVDYEFMRRLQDEQGLRFAYHCNAGEVACYDAEKVAEVFNEDIEFLAAKGLDIRCFSPHGGVAGPDGLNNHSFFYPSFSKRRLYWTHNKYAPSGRRYSDGGMHARLPKNDLALDIRTFFKILLESRAAPAPLRCFMLIHPQYYFAKDAELAARHFPGNPWLEEFWEANASGRTAAYWAATRAKLESAFG